MKLLDYFKLLGWQEALPLFLVENLAVMLLAVGFGYLLQAGHGRTRALGPIHHPISRQEIRFAVITLLINTLITCTGCTTATPSRSLLTYSSSILSKPWVSARCGCYLWLRIPPASRPLLPIWQ
jgi:hypothetical protein